MELSGLTKERGRKGRKLKRAREGGRNGGTEEEGREGKWKEKRREGGREEGKKGKMDGFFKNFFFNSRFSFGGIREFEGKWSEFKKFKDFNRFFKEFGNLKENGRL